MTRVLRRYVARDFLLGILEGVRVLGAEPADRVLVDYDVLGRYWSLMKRRSFVYSLALLVGVQLPVR